MAMTQVKAIPRDSRHASSTSRVSSNTLHFNSTAQHFNSTAQNIAQHTNTSLRQAASAAHDLLALLLVLLLLPLLLLLPALKPVPDTVYPSKETSNLSAITAIHAC